MVHNHRFDHSINFELGGLGFAITNGVAGSGQTFPFPNCLHIRTSNREYGVGILTMDSDDFWHRFYYKVKRSRSFHIRVLIFAFGYWDLKKEEVSG